MMTNEQIIKHLKELKQQKLDELQKLDARRDSLLDFVGNLHWLITEAEKGESND